MAQRQESRRRQEQRRFRSTARRPVRILFAEPAADPEPEEEALRDPGRGKFKEAWARVKGTVTKNILNTPDAKPPRRVKKGKKTIEVVDPPISELIVVQGQDKRRKGRGPGSGSDFTSEIRMSGGKNIYGVSGTVSLAGSFSAGSLEGEVDEESGEDSIPTGLDIESAHGKFHGYAKVYRKSQGDDLLQEDLTVAGRTDMDFTKVSGVGFVEMKPVPGVGLSVDLGSPRHRRQEQEEEDQE